ncbi:MAG: DegT/DnrJ/EryC1/StrS family aminotransferase [Polyangia bacterium]
MLDLPRLHRPLREDLRRALDEALASGRFIGGPAVERFEAELAAHVGARRAVGLSSGTDALLAALMALDLRPGDEVITSPYTFFATAGAIARLGATPVFADIEPRGFNIDPRAAAAAVTERTVGVVPVHLFGQTAEIDPLLELAAGRGLWVLEDAAQAIGALDEGRRAGTIGAAGVFSFFPAKNLGALGDAGALVTGDDALADRVRALRQHGGARRYEHDEVGGNFRLDALQAAFLSIKLPRLAGWEEGRRRVAARYRAALADVGGLVLPAELPGRRHVYNQHVIRVPGEGRRDALRDLLSAAGVASAVYYPRPLHLQPCFAHLGQAEGSLPESERASRETLAIPVDPLLEERDQNLICDTISRL